MKRTIILSLIAILLTAASLGYFVFRRDAETRAMAETENTTGGQGEKSEKKPENLVVAPGVVEPISEEIEVGAEIPGKLNRVLVEEGEQVVKGQTIATLENADFKSNIAQARAKIEILVKQKETAKARLSQAQAERTRVFNGARPEERAEARKDFERVEPEIAQAKNEFERRRRLYDSGDVSREDYERARRNYETAQKQSETLRAKYNVVNAEARADDLQKADAAIRLAETQIAEYDALLNEAETSVRTAQANLDKTIVRSPITGVVLRKRLKDGESVSPENSLGIVTIADVSALRVRVDLDETDVARVRVGQSAYVIADAFGNRKFTGKIIKIGQILGRKNFRTTRPTEKVDTKILETLLELDKNQLLPLGLRVDAFIAADDETNSPNKF